MFSGEADSAERAAKIAKWLANHNNFKTHSRPVWMEQLLVVEPMMKVRRLQDVSKEFEAAVMAVYWTIDVTFNDTDAIKLIERQEGSAYIQLMRTTITGPPVPLKPATPTPPQNRAERRRQPKGTK